MLLQSGHGLFLHNDQSNPIVSSTVASSGKGLQEDVSVTM